MTNYLIMMYVQKYTYLAIQISRDNIDAIRKHLTMSLAKISISNDQNDIIESVRTSKKLEVKNVCAKSEMSSYFKCVLAVVIISTSLLFYLYTITNILA